MFRTNFLDSTKAASLAKAHGTPLFVYSHLKLAEQAKTILSIPAPYGLTIRYAMKANPNSEILEALRQQGICIDASSGYEAQIALDQGFRPEHILLTSQQLAHNLQELVEQGVQFNATSLHQLEEYGKLFPGTSLSVRINPGIGSGHSSKTNVGGVASSFGIWYKYIPEIHELAQKYELSITRLHTHIGAGTDPVVWQQAARTSLELVEQFPDVTTLDLGGGFKVARMDDEQGADMVATGSMIATELTAFAEKTGRKLHLELEPGTFMVANVGVLLARVDDVVDTGQAGYHFLKLNTGMNDILRPSYYGSQHPIAVLNETHESEDYVVVGHNCESGDLLTPDPNDSDTLATRLLNKAAIGDLVVIGGTGAYCASMAAHGYNSFPDANEIII
jgi:diaminopimelate decarboxylase